ncbi:hypothetical protein Zmor_020871 [Zophobas morio]|uniref:Reverse transcriptase domain-containing protein n=1 Tax=Zophobas morio TaxID=2755281 RepID=A0AA38I4H1_9CUCU|nr:hypothetical protein Zmor_020871 [Zophobas morio]
MQISEAHNSYLDLVQRNLKSNPSNLWNYLNQRRSSTRIPGRVHNGLSEYTDPQTIVNGFAENFSKSYSSDSAHIPSQSSSNALPFQFPYVSPVELINIMSKFHDKFTAGDDLIPSFIVRDCRYAFAEPLSLIFNLAIKTSTFPSKWKCARICPILKKGDSSDVLNYRQISILPNFSKVFEQSLYLTVYSNVKKYISPYQHGFVSGRSTVSNLATITQYLSEIIDIRGQADVVYTDFTPAFDSIQHSILLQKLDLYGLSEDSLLLMRSYLKDRTSYVAYSGYVSYKFSVNSGVPQGSNLGPLLFILFINDLLEQFSCPVLAYADDIKLYHSIGSPVDVDILQNNINLMISWCDMF